MNSKVNYIVNMLFGLLCLFPFRMHAQECDSIPLTYFYNPLNAEYHKKITADASGITLLPKSNFSHSVLKTGYEIGSLHHLQTTENTQTTSFKSIGLYSDKNWQVYGEFIYTRGASDSVAWLLSEPPKNGLPYYFASAHKGNWTLEKYRVNGVASVTPIQLLTIGAGANISTFNGARSNDPRPLAKSYQTLFSLFAGTHFAHTHVLLNASIGKSTRNNEIIFSNDYNDKDNDYMPIELMGFGLFRKTQVYQNRQIESIARKYSYGFRIARNTKNNNLWFAVRYLHEKDSIYRDRTSIHERNCLSVYKLTKLSSELGATYTLRDFSIKTALSMENDKGKDMLFNIIKGQNNYVYRYKKYSWVSVLRKQKFLQNNYNEFGWKIDYETERKADGSTNHLFERSNLSILLNCTIHRPIGTHYNLFGIIMPGVDIGNAHLTVPETQINYFTTNFAIPIRDFYQTPQGKMAISIGCSRMYAKQYLVSLVWDSSLAFILKKVDSNGNNISQPSGYRLTSNLSLRLNF